MNNKIKPIIYITSLLVVLSLFAFNLSSDEAQIPQTTTTFTIPEVDPIVLAAVGDISCSADQRKSKKYPCVDAQVADLVTSYNPDYFLPLGDLQYNTASHSRLTGIYHKTWGHLYDITLPVPGNHEYSDGGRANGYFKYFPQIARPGYYSKDLNDKWMVIALNTNDDCTIESCAKGSKQYNWLVDTLAQNYNKCIIVMAHHPRYSSGVHGNNDYLDSIWAVLERYKVPIVLSGHDHNYERFNTSPVQFVVGTGGKDLRRLKSTRLNSAFVTNKHHGALILSVNDSVVDTSFVDIDNNVIDTSRITCSI